LFLDPNILKPIYKMEYVQLTNYLTKSFSEINEKILIDLKFDLNDIIIFQN
jgi:hypothetical protein